MPSEAVLRGLQAALQWVMGFGLERFLPHQPLKVGEPIPETLDPPDVRDRPHLTCVFWLHDDVSVSVF